MRKIVAMVAAVTLALLAFGPALAGSGHDHGKAEKAQLTGWIVDEKCGKGNANAASKDCVIACNKGGSPLVLAAGDKIYKLSDQKLALEHVGHAVVVTGTVGEDGTIQVGSIEKAGDKKA